MFFARNRAFLVPEVVQSSNMDCGPAALKSLLEGYRIPVSYGRLRDACQTSIDGTSIDSLEEIAVQFGLDAEQVLIPLDHLFLSSVPYLPALLVVLLPNNNTHFLIVWERYKNLVQVMDPANGRQWRSREALLEETYIHRMPVLAQEWRDWVQTEDFVNAIQERMSLLKISPKAQQAHIEAMHHDTSWETSARLDAALRLVSQFVKTGGLKHGQEAESSLEALMKQPELTIPPRFWTVQALGEDDEGQLQLEFRGAVLIRTKGRLPEAPALAPQLETLRQDERVHIWREIWRLLYQSSGAIIFLLFVALVIMSVARLVELLMLKQLGDLSQALANPEQRSMAALFITAFFAFSFVIELLYRSGLRWLGRRLELQLRLEIFQKIPKLGYRYFGSRLGSDMAERSHSLHEMRELPLNIANLFTLSLRIIFTSIALIWLFPEGWGLILALAAASFFLALFSHNLTIDPILRAATYRGIISQSMLQAMLGLLPARSHNAERVLRREFEILRLRFRHIWLQMYETIILADTLRVVVGYGLVIALIWAFLSTRGNNTQALLFLFWSLEMVLMGELVSNWLYAVNRFRGVYVRILEPLSASEDESPLDTYQPETNFAPLTIEMQNLSVQASGHTILSDINLCLNAGEHVAIVGRSGAGKSTLLGLLLGWNRPAEGQMLLDNQPLSPQKLRNLRPHIAWLDPEVYLWNKSLLDNLFYGSSRSKSPESLAELANLGSVLEKLPEGFQSLLGEAGALVSGGEGQRVRLARAFSRENLRLVLLDEPFRGLDRSQRQSLLQRARSLWKEQTLLCVTHDIQETLNFDRVLLVDNGQIAEDGKPQELAQDENSLYHLLLKAEVEAQAELRSHQIWRRLWLEKGQIQDV